ISYFTKQFKNFPQSRVPITPKACISSATCCGISSKRSFVYHQAAGGCTLARDEMQGRLAALDDIHRASRGDDMPSLRLE
ncbi:MAG: hypothetical protein IIW31_00440, partial [Clostridia bacterium]|nr:hypothetical protein [Clostridia bacterium]